MLLLLFNTIHEFNFFFMLNFQRKVHLDVAEECQEMLKKNAPKKLTYLVKLIRKCYNSGYSFRFKDITFDNH